MERRSTVLTKRNTSPSGTPLALAAVSCYDAGVASLATAPDLIPAFAAAFRSGTATERQANVQPEIAEHTIHRDWCPTCKKQVESVVLDTLSNSTFGHRAAVLTAWFHYEFGLTTSRISRVFNAHLHFELTDG